MCQVNKNLILFFQQNVITEQSVSCVIAARKGRAGEWSSSSVTHPFSFSWVWQKSPVQASTSDVCYSPSNFSHVSFTIIESFGLEKPSNIIKFNLNPALLSTPENHFP